MQEARETVTRADNLADIRSAYEQAGGPPSDRSLVDRGGCQQLWSLSVDVPHGRAAGPMAGAAHSRTLPRRRLGRSQHALDRRDLQLFRAKQVPLRTNRALRQCRRFESDVLIVESENDHLVAHPTIASYIAFFTQARSITHRVISGADHALSKPESRRSYDELLLRWVREMILNAR